ncbi:MAG TPA: hypothetical protein ENJ95_13700 [Bacteroidetes bacterium]|nr:hypothetical protein [Bacteroidota bacterium]
MKNIKNQFTCIIAVLAFFLAAQSATAQDEGHYFMVTTWKLHIPENGSGKELNSILEEWHKKVVLKNPKTISEKTLVHVSGSDQRDWVVITEYANWNDINEATKIDNKLVEEGWPDKAERKKFFEAFGKYSITHSDEILQEMPKLSK